MGGSGGLESESIAVVMTLYRYLSRIHRSKSGRLERWGQAYSFQSFRLFVHYLQMALKMKFSSRVSTSVKMLMNLRTKLLLHWRTSNRVGRCLMLLVLYLVFLS